MRLAPVFSALALGLLASATARADQVLHRMSEQEPETLDPQKSSSAGPLAIDRDLFTGLLTLDAQEKVVPGIAERWEIAPDGMTWTFHLRADAKWSNGEPLTADDFVYSFRRLVDPKTAAADPSDLTQLQNFQAIVSGKEKDLTKLGVKAVDAHTLTLSLTAPRLALKFLLTDPSLFPLHKASIEQWGNAWTQPEHLIGNGPFVMKSWVPQAQIVLTRNPNFYDAATVKLDQVDWIVTEDLKAGLLRYRAGELDWMRLNRQSLPWAKQNLADQLQTADINGFSFIFFNMKRGPLAGPEHKDLREALNLAIDRDTLVTKIDNTGGKAAYGIIPPAISDYTPQHMQFMGTPMPARLAKAKELMKAAGYGPDHPLELKLSYPTDDAARQIMLALAAMWKPIGVEVKLDNMEWQAFVGLVDERNYEIGYLSLVGSYDDYENGLDNYRSDAGTFNVNGYANPKFDDLFHRGGTSTDPLERRKLMEQAEQVVLDDYIMAPLEFLAFNTVVSPKLQGYVPKVVYNQSRYLWVKP